MTKNPEIPIDDPEAIAKGRRLAAEGFGDIAVFGVMGGGYAIQVLGRVDSLDEGRAIAAAFLDATEETRWFSETNIGERTERELYDRLVELRKDRNYNPSVGDESGLVALEVERIEKRLAEIREGEER